MKLLKGITGFRKVYEVENPTQIDEKKLKEFAHQCGNVTKFRLEEILRPNTSSNYYRLIYQHKITGQRIDLAINCQFPLYTGISSNSQWMQIRFVDLPAEIRTYFDPNFTFLEPEWLTTEFADEDLIELSEAEVDQIKYWESKTYGEVIFNGYD